MIAPLSEHIYYKINSEGKVEKVLNTFPSAYKIRDSFAETGFFYPNF